MENQLITILRITSPQLGDFVKNKFNDENIECFFANEDLALGSVYNPDEVLLKIKARQSEQAIKKLLELHKEFDLDRINDDASFYKLKRILFPVKLNEGCIELCKSAMLLARKINAELKLLYVYEDPEIDQPVKYTVSWEKHVQMELRDAHNKAQLKMVNFSVELKKIIPAELFSAVNLHYRMLKGTPEQVIKEASERYDPHLILIGTSGSTNDGEFMGKTAVKIVENSKYPVFVIPQAIEIKSTGRLNIMYATDFYNADNTSLKKLLKILEPFEKKIYCIHIDLNDDPRHQEKVEELNKMLQEDYSEHNIRCELFESENLEKGFEDFIQKNDINLISFSKIKRTAIYKLFHSTHIEKLVSIENAPKLIFPVE